MNGTPAPIAPYTAGVAATAREACVARGCACWRRSWRDALAKKFTRRCPRLFRPVPAIVEPPIPPYILGEEPADTTLAMIPESLPAPPPGAHACELRRASPPADPSPAEASRDPVISPQISAGDQAAYERRINENINTAERNLQQASAHQFNATQKDMAEKIRGFMDQAQEAMQASDWTRAQNLAQKAQVLSGELVNSF